MKKQKMAAGRSIPDTKLCPHCSEWILSPSGRGALDHHIWTEHQEAARAHEERWKEQTGSYTGRFPGLPSVSDEDAPEALRTRRVARERETRQTRDCLCGCGDQTPSLFRPGHDARLKGAMTRALKEGADLRTDERFHPEARARLATLFKGRFA